MRVRPQRDARDADLLADIENAVLLQPNYAKAFRSRGIVREVKGDLDGALADYNQAIRLKPDYTKAIANRDAVLKAIADRSKS